MLRNAEKKIAMYANHELKECYLYLQVCAYVCILSYKSDIILSYILSYPIAYSTVTQLKFKLLLIYKCQPN
jgi:hypothetical protein